MAIRHDKLRSLAGSDGPEPAPLPRAWGVLYAEPNPDGSRKLCQNCFMWSADDRCSIHDKDLKVTAEMICGYHVYGAPMEERVFHPGLEPVEPRQTVECRVTEAKGRAGRADRAALLRYGERSVVLSPEGDELAFADQDLVLPVVEGRDCGCGLAAARSAVEQS